MTSDLGASDAGGRGDAGTAAVPARAPVTWHLTNRGVMTITLDDPDARNVLNNHSVPMLIEAFELATSDERARVVVLTGSGNTFCAGADLRGAVTAGGAFDDRAPAAVARLLALMLDCPKPVVGRVQGHVAGGGNGLVAACDLAVAVEEARFAFSEVRVGVAPAVISTVCLRRMPPAIASELFLTGERVSAERAREAGLVHRVVEEVGPRRRGPGLRRRPAARRPAGPGADQGAAPTRADDDPRRGIRLDGPALGSSCSAPPRPPRA